jgi:methionyl-tRNA formyltransferase
MGTPAFAVASLSALLAAKMNVVAVVTAPDKPGGRGMQLQESAVKQFAIENNIPVLQPEKLKSPEFFEALKTLQPDLQVVVAFRMLPEIIWSFPPMGTLNVHGSLLPQYRGAAPINWAIVHGETETGATRHVMEVRPDAGDIVGQSAVSIGPNESATEVFSKVSQAAVTVMNQVLPELIQGHIPKKPNQLALGSYFGGRKPADGEIQWHQSAKQVHDLVRAVAPPYPGACTNGQGQRMIVARTSLEGSFPAQLNLQTLGIQVVDNQAFGVCGNQKAIVVLDWFPATTY